MPKSSEEPPLKQQKLDTESESEKCKGCDNNFKSILGHLSRSKKRMQRPVHQWWVCHFEKQIQAAI